MNHIILSNTTHKKTSGILTLSGDVAVCNLSYVKRYCYHQTY